MKKQKYIEKSNFIPKEEISTNTLTKITSIQNKQQLPDNIKSQLQDSKARLLQQQALFRSHQYLDPKRHHKQHSKHRHRQHYHRQHMDHQYHSKRQKFRGRNSEYQNHQIQIQKIKQKNKKHKHQHQHQHQSSNDSSFSLKGKKSSSNQSFNKYDKRISKQQKYAMRQIQKLSLDQWNIFQNFFVSRKVDLKQQNKIKLRTKKYYNKKQDVPEEYILSVIGFLEVNNYTKNVSFSDVFKIIFKQWNNIDGIVQKLQKKSAQRERKFYRKQKYQQQLENIKRQRKIKGLQQLKQIKFLTKKQLAQQITNEKILMLIDGNNIIHTCRNFQHLFYSSMKNKRAQVQIRLRWMCALAFSPTVLILFFDQLYQSQIYEQLINAIIPPKDIQAFNKISVIYGAGIEADIKILQLLKDMKNEDHQFYTKQSIIVSSDRLLVQKALNILPVWQSSGDYFFKAWRKIMNAKYWTHPDKKYILHQVYQNKLKQQEYPSYN